MAATPTEPSHDPTFRELDLSAEIRNGYGPEWNKPEVAYEWSNGKKHYLRTGDAAIYSSSPEF